MAPRCKNCKCSLTDQEHVFCFDCWKLLVITTVTTALLVKLVDKLF